MSHTPDTSFHVGYNLGCVCLHIIDERVPSSLDLLRKIFNFANYKSHPPAEQIYINKTYNIKITLPGICIYLPFGSHLRLSLSTSY